MFSLRPFAKLLALLAVLVPSLSVVAQPDEEVESVLLTNYNALRDEGQGFYLREGFKLYETPNKNRSSVLAVQWVCDLEFSLEDANTTTTSSNYGYVGRGVQYALGALLDLYRDEDAEPSKSSKKWPISVSSVLVPTLGLFEGQFHGTTDDWVYRYWDNGSATLPMVGWEGHDDGVTGPKADQQAFSVTGTFTKISTAAAAELLGREVTEMTPATCRTEYDAVWTAAHVLPDPIAASVLALEDEVAQLKADISELMTRMTTTEGSSTANGSDATSTSSSPFRALFEHTTMDNTVKAIVTVVIILGLGAVDFL